MSHISETAAVLMRAMDILQIQTSPAQYALACAEERRSALYQLRVTVETAAKLAEIARIDAVVAQRAACGDTAVAGEAGVVLARGEMAALRSLDGGVAQPGVLDDDDVEMMVKELEGLRVELEKGNSGELYAEEHGRQCFADVKALMRGEGEVKVAVGRMTVNERLLEYHERACRKGKRIREELERTVLAARERLLELEKVCSEKLEAEVERASDDLERSVQETERLRVEIDRVKSKTEKVEDAMKPVRAAADLAMRS